MGGTRKIRPWRHVVGFPRRNERPKVEGSVGRVGRSFRRGKLLTCRKGGDFSCEVGRFQCGVSRAFFMPVTINSGVEARSEAPSIM